MNIFSNSYLSHAMSLVLGAIISSLVSYLFSRIKEDRNLKLSLRLESSQIILHKLQDLIDDLYHLRYQNLYMDSYVKQIDKDDENSEFITELSKSTIEENDNFLKRLENAMYKSQILISTFESREVILNTLSHKKNELESLQMKVTLNYAEFSAIISMELNTRIDDLDAIPLEKYNEMKVLNSSFEIFRKNYIDYTNQFKRDIQNEYLSKLFKYRV